MKHNYNYPLFFSLFILLFSFYSPINSHAQNAPVAIEPIDYVYKTKAENFPLEKSLLWEISGNNLEAPSYLFGTIHAICKEKYSWPNHFDKAYNKAEVLVTEIDIHYIDQIAFSRFGTLDRVNYQTDYQMDELMGLLINTYYNFYKQQLEGLDFEIDTPTFNEVMQASAQRRLMDLLIEDIRANTLELTFDDLGLEEKDFPSPINGRSEKEYFNDYFDHLENEGKLNYYLIEEANGELAKGIFHNLGDCDHIFSYDGKLTLSALKEEKDILFLESIEEQMKMFMSEPTEEDELFERPIIKKEYKDEYDLTYNLYPFIIENYLQQDLNEMFNLSFSEEGGMPNINNFFFLRNQKWIPKIKDIIHHQSAFIAVGAGHLPGEYGLIDLLRKEGYTLKAIMNESDIK